MKKSVFLLLSLLASGAWADHNRGFFAGANIALASSESFLASETGADEVDFPGLELLAGYKYNGWLGIDIRYGAGLSERDTADLAGNNIEYKIASYQSYYYRPEITNNEAKLYFLIGYTKLDIDTETFDSNEALLGEDNYSESGSSYGMGAGWFVNDKVNVNVEYRELLDKNDDEFSLVSLGADFRF